MKPQIIGIESEVFDDLRDRFDKSLLVALRKMKDLKLAEGTVTAKISIGLVEATDENGDTVLMPEFSGQVEINLPMKGKIEVPRKGNLIMTQDRNSDGFIVASSQYTFMDLMEEQEDAE